MVVNWINEEQQGDVWSVEWEPASQCKTQRNVVPLTNAQIGVPGGHNDCCGRNCTRASNAHTACHLARRRWWNPFCRWRRAPSLGRTAIVGQRQAVKSSWSLENLLFSSYPVLPCWSPEVRRNRGREGGKETGFQRFRLVSGSAGLKSWGQLGEGTTILLILKMKLF